MVLLVASFAILAVSPVGGAAVPSPTALIDHVGPVPVNGGWIGPGAHLIIDRPDGTFGCTANFVWKDGAKTYLGAAGHCFLPADKAATHGPGADFDPSGVVVRVCTQGCEFGGQSGFSFPGHLETLGAVAYARQTASDGDIGNDFGIVEIPDRLLPLVTPAMPIFGGPTSIATSGQGLGCIYGNAAGLGEVVATKARVGYVTSIGAKSWKSVFPSFEGDSGSAIVACNLGADGMLHGQAAVGILTHIATNGVIVGTTVPRAIQMATEAGIHLSLQMPSG